MNLNLDSDLARRMAAPGEVEAALADAKAEYRRLAALGSRRHAQGAAVRPLGRRQ